MEKIKFKTVGMVLGALLLLFGFVNAIPWATNTDLQEIKQDLKEWYPRVIKMESEVEHIKEDVKEIKGDVKEIKELVR